MVTTDSVLRSEVIGIEDLHSEFLSLRIGEEIPRLEIRSIKKLTNSDRADNLASTNYKYLIEARDGKVLTVNSWVLWKKIAAALKDTGTIEATLKLEHHGREDYRVEVLSESRK